MDSASKTFALTPGSATYPVEGVVIFMDPVVLTQHSLINNLQCLTSAQQSFLHALIEVGRTVERVVDDSVVILRSEVQAWLQASHQGHSVALISRRLTELKTISATATDAKSGEGGPITLRGTEFFENRSRVNVYQITDLSALARVRLPKQDERKPRQRRSKLAAETQSAVLRSDLAAMFLQDPGELRQVVHEKLFNGILDVAMRLSSKDPRKTIQVDYIINNTPLRIRSVCRSSDDSDLAVLSDQRMMRALVSYCRQHVRRLKSKLRMQHGDDFHESMIPNLFHVDVRDLCSLMGMTVASENEEAAAAMLYRLADTEYQIDASDNPWFMQRFSYSGKADQLRISFLYHLEVARESQQVADLFGIADVKQLKPRYFTFALDDRLFISMLDEEATNWFLSHPELTSERSGMIQRFYNWARAFVGGRAKEGLVNRWYTMRDMHEILTPAARFDNFRTLFLRALQRQAVPTKTGGTDWSAKEGTALVYGYYVRWDLNRNVEGGRIQVWRDRDDPIVGDQSLHNRLLRQQDLDLMEDTDDSYSRYAGSR